MKLKELLGYNDIVVQCHDNPDADALASGYALYWYFKAMGKNVRFIYRGRNKIRKSNLLIMVNRLEIPVSYEPDFSDIPELLVVADCQYGQKNITKTEAENIAVIDHHNITVDVPELSEVRSNLGSCSTIVWDMIKKEGLSIDGDKNLSTALYYGLYTDTNRLSEVAHPLDKDMRDSLEYRKDVIIEMTNSNLSLKELKITGKAILDYKYYDDFKYLILQAEKCDPNILGVISDFSLETEGVNVCIAYCVSEYEIKFSVRSCVKEVHANELATFIANGIGGGGGHIYKAGGTVRPEKLREVYYSIYDDKRNSESDEILEDITEEDILAKMIYDIFNIRIVDYFEKYEIIYAKNTELDITDMKLYEKQPQELGYVKLSDVFPEGTKVEIRTLEGDVNIVIGKESYLMIGIEGEVYPIAKEKLSKSYKELGVQYSRRFEYEPSIKNIDSGEVKKVLKYAHGVISTGKSRIYAKTLDKSVKLFTEWDEEKYYSGDPGDYIAVRDDDKHDIYIIRGRLFHELYKEIV